MLKDDLDQLIDIATGDYNSDNIIDARNEYQSIAGIIYEDDKSYENRMALFLEWYIFDRISPDTNQTLLETLIEINKQTWSSNMLQIFEGFSINIHGLFIVKKIRDHSVKVLNLFNNEIYVANESLGKLLFYKSGIFEGRLVSYDNMYHFTGNFCFHPNKAKKFIEREIKQMDIIIRGNKKELKINTAQLSRRKNELKKHNSKIDKLKTKLLKSYPDNKILTIKKNLTELETIGSYLDGNFLNMESEIKKFASEKTIRVPKTLQTQLIQKLSYMQLAWERSRHIDLDDIYHN